MIFSLSLLIPAMVANFYHEECIHVFLATSLILFFIGFICWFPVRRYSYEPKLKEGFLLVFCFWFTAGLLGSLPFILLQTNNFTYVDALFESFSGLTATGSTVLHGLDFFPKAIIFYRAQLQFLGGMGIILLAIAILPALGVGGMQLFKAEVAGPTKENKLTPRLAQSAKGIWMIYTTLTVFCCIAYWAAGMNIFDAICYSFTTISTGGFAPHDASIGFFHSAKIEVIAIVFMFLGGTNFALHFVATNNSSMWNYIKDEEFIFYSKLIVIISFITVGTLIISDDTYDYFKVIIDGVFQVVSMITTTGFITEEFSFWPLYTNFIIINRSYRRLFRIYQWWY